MRKGVLYFFIVIVVGLLIVGVHNALIKNEIAIGLGYFSIAFAILSITIALESIEIANESTRIAKQSKNIAKKSDKKMKDVAYGIYRDAEGLFEDRRLSLIKARRIVTKKEKEGINTEIDN